MEAQPVTLRGRANQLNTRFSQNGTQMNTFSLAVYAGKDQEGNYNPSLWMDCLFFGENPPQEKAEIVCAGYLAYDTWTDKPTGEQRGKHKLIVKQWHPHVRDTQGYGQQSNGQNAYVPF